MLISCTLSGGHFNIQLHNASFAQYLTVEIRQCMQHRSAWKRGEKAKNLLASECSHLSFPWRKINDRITSSAHVQNFKLPCTVTVSTSSSISPPLTVPGHAPATRPLKPKHPSIILLSLFHSLSLSPSGLAVFSLASPSPLAHSSFQLLTKS